MNEPLHEFKSITSLSEDEKADLAAFSCGIAEIDQYLHEDALDDAKCNITRTFLFYSPEKELIGYFSLTADRARVIKRSKLKGKLPKHPYFSNNDRTIPAIQIHHFAIDKEWQKNDLGRFLMLRVIAIVKENILPNVGVTLLTVHALNQSVGFYQKLGFEKTGDYRDKNTNMALILCEVL